MLDNKGRDQFGVILCAGFFGKSCALEFLFWELWRLNMAYLEFKILECELRFSGCTPQPQPPQGHSASICI
jgi:hypothetical protein